MKRTLLALAIVFLCFVSAGCTASEKGERKMVEGAWVPVDGELGGLPFPAEVLKTMSLTIKDGQYTVKVGQQLDKGTVTVNTGSTPKAMDIAGTEGPNKGRVFPAIYELTGDVLRICYDLTGKQRPTVFTTQKGTQQFLVSYKRASS